MLRTSGRPIEYSPQDVKVGLWSKIDIEQGTKHSKRYIVFLSAIFHYVFVHYLRYVCRSHTMPENMKFMSQSCIS